MTADPLLTTEQVAERIGVTPEALEHWRYRGAGPPWLKLSHKVVRYRQSELERWLDSRTRRSTA